MKFSEKLSILCRDRGLSHVKLADRLDGIVSRGTVGNWLIGKSVPSLDVSFKLAKLFNVSVDYLADDEQDVPVEWQSLDPDLDALIRVASEIGYRESLRRIASPSVPLAPPSIAPPGVTPIAGEHVPGIHVKHYDPQELLKALARKKSGQ
jgi:transcriptional regulator with XRE-family HTH domain